MCNCHRNPCICQTCPPFPPTPGPIGPQGPVGPAGSGGTDIWWSEIGSDVSISNTVTYYGMFAFIVGVTTIDDVSYQYKGSKLLTAKNFTVKIRDITAIPSFGNIILTVMKNGIATPLTFTIPNTAGVGSVYSDTVHSFTFTTDDKIAISAVTDNGSLSMDTVYLTFEVG